MGVLDVLSGLATAGGHAAAGEAIDQQTAVKNALAQAQLEEEQKRNAVLNALGNRDLARIAQGDPGYGAYEAGVIGQTGQAQTGVEANRLKTLAPITTQNEVDRVNALALPTAQAKATEIKTVAPVQTQADVDRTNALAKPEAQAAGEKAGAVQAATLPGQIKLKTAALATTPEAQRAGAVLPQLDSALATLGKYSDPGVAGRLFKGRALGGYAISDEGQNALQGYQQFARAYLSARTMRNPTAAEVDKAVNEMMPQPGEQNNPTVLAQKASLLQQRRDEIARLALQPEGGGRTATLGGFDDLQAPTAAPLP